MRTYRTVLEQKIRERRFTLEEFAEYAETFAREHGEPGTLSVRHLQRLVAGEGSKGQSLGPVRPVTARLLERIFDVSADELLAAPSNAPPLGAKAGECGALPDQLDTRTKHVSGECDGAEAVGPAADWLDERAGWSPQTARAAVRSRLAAMSTGALLDRNAQRKQVGRSAVAEAVSAYYGTPVADWSLYRAQCAGRDISTSILTRPDWLGLACPLSPENDRLTLQSVETSVSTEIDSKSAVQRLAEVAALDIRMTNEQLYRLLNIDTGANTLTGTFGLAPFTEYALANDLLEGELLDAISQQDVTELPLRARYLPDFASVLDLSGRFCVGGALALCAIARPADPYRGEADYAFLVQERSGHVLNAVDRLAVIPKGFHQPLKEPRADTRIGATLRREMEEELFGRGEVDSTAGKPRVAAPMHPNRLSEPMRWLLADPRRLRTECTGFGFNLVSGNYEFASLIVIEDEEFWKRYGGEVEANWEASGLRLYSSLDRDLVADLVADESWSNEGLFALLQGVRRLGELGDERINLPAVETPLTRTASAR